MDQGSSNASASGSEGVDVSPSVRDDDGGDTCEPTTSQLTDQSRPALDPAIKPTLQAQQSDAPALAPPKRKKSRALSNSRSESASAAASKTASTLFPMPFKCSGDFCGLELRNFQAPNGGGSNSTSSVGAAGRRTSLPPTNALLLLFSPDEVAVLTGDVAQLLASSEISKRANGSEQADVASEGLRVIAFKSIALARGNKTHLATDLAAQERAKKYRDAPCEAAEGSGEPRKRRMSHQLDSTAAQQLREGSRTRVYGELDGVANYYRQVRVCGDCYAIYSLLDMAWEMAAGGAGEKKSDEIRARQQAKHHAELEQQWAAQIDRQVADKEKLYLRKRDSLTDKPSDQSSGSDSVVVTPGIDAMDLATSSSTSSLPALWSPKPDPSAVLKPDGLALTDGNHRNTVSTASLPRAPDKSSSLTLPELSSSQTTNPTATVASPTTRSPIRQRIEGRDKFVGVERYLRGESKRINDHALEEGRLFREAPLSSSTTDAKTLAVRPLSSSRPRSMKPSAVASAATARVLVVCSDVSTLNELHQALEARQQPSSSSSPVRLAIESSSDGAHALRSAQESFYDVVLVERELAGELSGLELAKLLRASQIQQSVTTGGTTKGLSTSAIICVTASISRDDLQLYRDCGMDGCIGKPVNRESVSRTVQAALAHMAATSSSTSTARPTAGNNAVDAATEAIARAKMETQERRRQQRRRHQTRLEAASVLSMPGLADLNAREDYVHGDFQLDAATCIPYCVMGDPNLQPATAKHNTFFNLVVVHDLFDTWERLQILLQPIIAKYNGAAQVLLWNYPGQAYTTWRRGALLNNDYHAQCLHALLQHVSQEGGEGGDQKRLLRDAPYYLVGIGNGGSIAMAFCTHSPPLDGNTRALLLVDAFSFVDAKLAQFLHDCLKVFACTPVSRPDLPVYFHSRFLFSPAYLARVTTPMALNLYTAVMNPITLDGRAALCSGALAHRDLRGQLTQRGLRMPIVNVCSTQNALVSVSEQVEALLKRGKLDVVDSIGKILMRRPSDNGKRQRRSCVLWLASGHEVLQERKADVLLLLEQLVTGFHEVNDPPHGKTESSTSDSVTSVEASRRRPSPDKSKSSTGDARGSNFEDRFIDRVLTTVNQVVPAPQASDSKRPNSSSGASRSRPGSSFATSGDHTSKWIAHQQAAAGDAAKKKAAVAATDTATKPSASPSKANTTATSPVTWDPTTPAFERLSANVIYKIGQGSKIYPGAVPAATSLPEVKEYMGWRVRRNQKRLQRMNQMAAVIQRAFRAFAARMLLVKIKRARCAVLLQRVWRAKIARRKYKGMKKEDWAARLLQRHWRGKLGRDSYRDKMRKYLAAVDMQRIARGWLARQLASRIRTLRKQSAARIQCEIRRFLAVRRLFAQRRRRNAATTIQRVFRGHVGRRRFDRERDKLLFSRTQSQGIAFGKQMLLEYKLFGTKLQSEVALLAREKQEVERQAELVLKEIASSTRASGCSKPRCTRSARSRPRACPRTWTRRASGSCASRKCGSTASSRRCSRRSRSAAKRSVIWRRSSPGSIASGCRRRKSSRRSSGSSSCYWRSSSRSSRASSTSSRRGRSSRSTWPRPTPLVHWEAHSTVHPLAGRALSLLGRYRLQRQRQQYQRGRARTAAASTRRWPTRARRSRQSSARRPTRSWSRLRP